MNCPIAGISRSTGRGAGARYSGTAAWGTELPGGIIEDPQRLQKPESSGTLLPQWEQNVPNPVAGVSGSLAIAGVFEGVFSMIFLIGWIVSAPRFGKGCAAAG